MVEAPGVQFDAIISRFDKQGEKTGWTYINVPASIAQQLLPGNKKSFRVKGYLDHYSYHGIALPPMGGGDFIMPLNAAIRKGIQKNKGASIYVQLQVDTRPIDPPPEFIECLQDEPLALQRYNALTKSHRNYFIKWIEGAKTDATKAKRIGLAVTALHKGIDFGEMIRSMKNDKKEFLR